MRKRTKLNNYNKVSINSFFSDHSIDEVLNSFEDDFLSKWDKEEIIKFYNLLIEDGASQREGMLVIGEFIHELNYLKSDELRHYKKQNVFSEIEEETQYINARRFGLSLEKYNEELQQAEDLNSRDSSILDYDEESQIMKAISSGNGDLCGY